MLLLEHIVGVPTLVASVMYGGVVFCRLLSFQSVLLGGDCSFSLQQLRHTWLCMIVCPVLPCVFFVTDWSGGTVCVVGIVGEGHR